MNVEPGPMAPKARDTTSLAAFVNDVGEDVVRQLMMGHLNTLSERQAGILSIRLGLTDGKRRTQAEVARVYGISTARVSQVERDLVHKLRRVVRQSRRPPPAVETKHVDPADYE